MLKTVKNGFIAEIKQSGFEPADFTATEEQNTFVLAYKDTSFQFIIEARGPLFRVISSRFQVGFPLLGHDASVSLLRVYQLFSAWLKGDLRDYIAEVNTPDLWEQMSRETPVLKDTMFEDEERKEFSDEEKLQLKLSVSQFGLLIKEHFSPTGDQLKVIEERLAYLSDGVDRLNKFDWKSILLSSIVTIVATLSLNTEQGRVLYNLAKQAFSHIVYLNP